MLHAPAKQGKTRNGTKAEQSTKLRRGKSWNDDERKCEPPPIVHNHHNLNASCLAVAGHRWVGDVIVADV